MPVALALDRQLRDEPYHVRVGILQAYLRVPGDQYHDGLGVPRRMIADIPDPAQSFIHDFDRGRGPVHPLDFPLDFEAYS